MSFRPRSGLAILIVLASGLTAPAAPAPPPSGGPVEKYLPDDTEAVVVLNVKQVVASPLFVKNYKKKFEGLLAVPAVAAWLKDSGIDPLRDVHRATFFMARSLDTGPPTEGLHFSLLLQGRFDAAKFRTKMGERAKTLPKVVKILDAGANPLYEINPPPEVGPSPPMFVGLVDRDTLLMTFRKDAFGVMRDKATGKKKTVFKYPALARMLKDLKPEVSLGVMATREAALTLSHKKTAVPGGGERVEVKYHTLGEDGIEDIQAAATFAADFRFRVTVTAPNAGQAKDMAKSLSRGLKTKVASLKDRATTQPDLAPVVKALEAIKARAAGAKIIVEVEGTAEVLEGLLQSTGIMRAFPDSSRK